MWFKNSNEDDLWERGGLTPRKAIYINKVYRVYHKRDIL